MRECERSGPEPRAFQDLTCVTRTAARRQGIGTAITVAAATAFGSEADLAWLHPDDGARAMYERLGFREISTWEVWTRPRPVA